MKHLVSELVSRQQKVCQRDQDLYFYFEVTLFLKCDIEILKSTSSQGMMIPREYLLSSNILYSFIVFKRELVLIISK